MRPSVSINTENKIEDFLRNLESNISSFKSLKGVVGITLNGGLSRGFADDLSEIDITIYLEDKIYSKWQKEKSPIPIGITRVDNYLYDIKVVSYETEISREFNDIDLWDYSYAKILHDPYKKISKLFDIKINDKPDIARVTGLMWVSYWNYKLAGDIWINRSDPTQAHFMLNEAIKPLLKSLYIINREYIPHEKWLIHMSYTLKWLPINWEDKLKSVFKINDLTNEEVVKRQSIIEEVWDEIENYIKDNFYSEFHLSIHQKMFYDLLKYLVNIRKISVTDWEKKANLSILNLEPFHSVIDIKNNYIYLNVTKFMNINSNDLYSWHYEILNEIRKESGN